MLSFFLMMMVPYANTKYIACFSDGTQKEGITDENGYTENFNTD